MNKQNHLPELPKSEARNYFEQLLNFGNFLERETRAGCQFDLNFWPNPLWQLIQQSLESGLAKFFNQTVLPGKICLLQWYNSGIIIRTDKRAIGFDLIPIPRYYNWPDTANLTQQLAHCLDALFITHHHEDHFDLQLVEALLSSGKPVFSHPEIAGTAKPGITACNDEETFIFQEFSVIPRHAFHVWREKIDEVPLVYFEVSCPSDYTFIFSGDADYTKNFTSLTTKLDTLFIPWRNPNFRFEEGHPQQKGNTMDALEIAIARVNPRQIILEHYAELDHIYKGFGASYDLAINLINHSPVKTCIYFPGEFIFL